MKKLAVLMGICFLAAVAGCDDEEDLSCWEEYRLGVEEQAQCVFQCAEDGDVREAMLSCWEDEEACVIECIVEADWHKTVDESNCVLDCPVASSGELELEDCLGEEQPQCAFPDGYGSE